MHSADFIPHDFPLVHPLERPAVPVVDEKFSVSVELRAVENLGNQVFKALSRRDVVDVGARE